MCVVCAHAHTHTHTCVCVCNVKTLVTPLEFLWVLAINLVEYSIVFSFYSVHGMCGVFILIPMLKFIIIPLDVQPMTCCISYD